MNNIKKILTLISEFALSSYLVRITMDISFLHYVIFDFPLFLCNVLFLILVIFHIRWTIRKLWLFYYELWSYFGDLGTYKLKLELLPEALNLKTWA